MSYLRQIPAMFSVDLTEFEADVPVLLSGNEKGLNVSELKEACENDKYSVTLLVDVTGETQDKLYFTKVAYSEENGGYFFAGGNEEINGLMIEFAETVTGTHMILLGFKGAGGGGVAVMTREEWNAVEKKNEYGLVAVLDYSDKYIAGTLYNGEYFVNPIVGIHVDNGVLVSDNISYTSTPVVGTDEYGDYFNKFAGSVVNIPELTNEKVKIEFTTNIQGYGTIIQILFGNGSMANYGSITMQRAEIRVYNKADQVAYAGFAAVSGKTKFTIILDSVNKEWEFYVNDTLISEGATGTFLDIYKSIMLNPISNNSITNFYDFSITAM